MEVTFGRIQLIVDQGQYIVSSTLALLFFVSTTELYNSVVDYNSSGVGVVCP